jgi:hypothetical protein
VNGRTDRDPSENPLIDAAREDEIDPAAGSGAQGKLGTDADATEQVDTSRAEPGSLPAAAHDSYWRRNFAGRPYTDESHGYEYYRPAYRYGWESRDRFEGRRFEEVEEELRGRWDRDRMGLEWEEAKQAVRDAFETRPATEWSSPGNPLA